MRLRDAHGKFVKDKNETIADDIKYWIRIIVIIILVVPWIVIAYPYAINVESWVHDKILKNTCTNNNIPKSAF